MRTLLLILKKNCHQELHNGSVSVLVVTGYTVFRPTWSLRRGYVGCAAERVRPKTVYWVCTVFRTNPVAV